MPLERINPADLATPQTYTHVIVATGSRLVFVAGPGGAVRGSQAGRHASWGGDAGAPGLPDRDRSHRGRRRPVERFIGFVTDEGVADVVAGSQTGATATSALARRPSISATGKLADVMRHSFASLLLHEGRSVIYVARQLGHGAELTMRTYGHVIEELEDRPQLRS